MLVSAIQHESIIIIYPLLLKPSHPTPLGCHRALSWAPCVTQQLPTSYMVVYIHQSCSLNSSCHLHPLLCQVCSLCLCPLNAGLNIANHWGHALLNTPPDTWHLLYSECFLRWLVEIWTTFCSVSTQWLPSCFCLVVLSLLPGLVTHRCPSADDSKGPLRPPACMCLCVCFSPLFVCMYFFPVCAALSCPGFCLQILPPVPPWTLHSVSSLRGAIVSRNTLLRQQWAGQTLWLILFVPYLLEITCLFCFLFAV